MQLIPQQEQQGDISQSRFIREDMNGFQMTRTKLQTLEVQSKNCIVFCSNGSVSNPQGENRSAQ